MLIIACVAVVAAIAGGAIVMLVRRSYSPEATT